MEKDKKKLKKDKKENKKEKKAKSADAKAMADKEEKELTIEEQLVEVDGKYKRALADYQNLLKRQSKEKEEFVKYANENLLTDFIPVYDNLKISLEHVGEDDKDNPWVKGIEYVIKQFRDLLESNGIEEIKTVGEKFDHETMDAMEGEGEKVIKEVKAGYKLNGKVIMPAKVVVGK